MDFKLLFCVSRDSSRHVYCRSVCYTVVITTNLILLLNRYESTFKSTKLFVALIILFSSISPKLD